MSLLSVSFTVFAIIRLGSSQRKLILLIANLQGMTKVTDVLIASVFDKKILF